MKDIVYFVFGAAVGAILACFIAPQSGKAMRADIQVASEEDWQNFQAQWQAGMQKMYASVGRTHSELKRVLSEAAVKRPAVKPV